MSGMTLTEVARSSEATREAARVLWSWARFEFANGWATCTVCGVRSRGGAFGLCMCGSEHIDVRGEA